MGIAKYVGGFYSFCKHKVHLNMVFVIVVKVCNGQVNL